MTSKIDYGTVEFRGQTIQILKEAYLDDSLPLPCGGERWVAVGERAGTEVMIIWEFDDPQALPEDNDWTNGVVAIEERE